MFRKVGVGLSDYVEQAELRSDRVARGTRGRLVWEINARLLRGAEILNAALVEAIRDQPLTLNEYYTLTLLQNHPRGQLGHKVLAEQTFSSTSTITNRIDRLESRGLVRRIPDPNDRRGMLVEITGDGRETALATTTHVSRTHAAWLRSFDEEGLKRINAGLREILEILDGPDCFGGEPADTLPQQTSRSG